MSTRASTSASPSASRCWRGSGGGGVLTRASKHRKPRQRTMPSCFVLTVSIQKCHASAEAKALLNQAAVLRGQKLSEFMLESARRQAEETILERRTFFLDDSAHA